ncbi:MAG: hypothetical protein AVDCRST_MAG52-930, partial [uncultured Blastococcus sp.]
EHENEEATAWRARCQRGGVRLHRSAAHRPRPGHRRVRPRLPGPGHPVG